ncbi:MAG: response regulator transcription factor [Acidobacteria bacterium]|nr:response regulator transcription factor [Acidobacteriota bacterium]
MIQVFSSNFLAAKYIAQALSLDPELADRISTPVVLQSSEDYPRGGARLFILDLQGTNNDLFGLLRTLRVRCSGSRFLALLPPGVGDEEILRLLYSGLDGLVVLSENFDGELTAAVRSVLEGNLWAPQRSLAQYVQQTSLLADKRFLAGCGITGRESQVLQLMLRRLSNSEIADVLGVSQRTVRFHVSNLLAKLGVEGRRGLLPALSELARKPA